MKIIALEEHSSFPRSKRLGKRCLPSAEIGAKAINGALADRLADTAEQRLRAMDEAGVDVVVLSMTATGTQSLDAAEAVAIARETNEFIAAAVRRNPARFQGFATLPTPAPRAAADELRRAVESLDV